MEIFIERIEQAVTFGIDVYSFEVKPDQPFHGFKSIPQEPRIHVVHFQHSENGMRYGYYLESDSNYVQFDYDRAKELYVPRSLESDQDRKDAYYKFQELSSFMVAYPSVDEGDSWQEMTKFVKWLDIKYIAGSSGQFVYMDSAITTEEEKKVLVGVLTSRGQGYRESLPAQSEASLNYAPIVFKSKEAIRDDHKMQDFLDKSYYLNEVVLARYHHSSIYSLLGELQLAFLNTLLFGSYGSSLQWHNILELIYFSSQVKESVVFELDSMLAGQLKVLPEFYVDTMLNETVWRRIVGESFHEDKLQQTSAAVRKIWPNLDGESDADDYAEVTHHNLSDEGDDDAPVVGETVSYIPR
ncbi:LANO_0F11452g1_1 [Lachancea nothofagi CBS 11611]|uniref:LANO_0F11452g1_1 n=1 Tax=Lachancea nothofagi CBS 11611 TaxID=1266666 RepID=A0A1G4KB07_9SACH|nr:LANO_0F11452g1_1 [Lachancea nothofagi CBS 11611]